MTREQRKTTFFSVCVLGKERPESFWSWNKFYSISLIETSKIIPFSWAALLECLERHLLLSEDPENCSETYFDCTTWTRRCSLCWSYCEVSSASPLIQKQNPDIFWADSPDHEQADVHQNEGLNPLLSASTGCSLVVKRRGKFGPVLFEKQKICPNPIWFIEQIIWSPNSRSESRL